MTKKKNKLLIPKSKCCYADIKMGGIGDFREGDKQVTMYYICTKCGRACDSLTVIRKTWVRNPVTKIKGDGRGKIKEKIIKKEIKEDIDTSGCA